MGAAMATRIAMIMTTMIASISVKPLCRANRAEPFISNLPDLPVLVLSAIQTSSTRLGIDIKNVLPAPRLRLRIVLHGAHAPIFRSRHRINRNAAQESQLLAALDFHAVHQGVQIRGIALGIELLLECVLVGSIFVTVDGV